MLCWGGVIQVHLQRKEIILSNAGSWLRSGVFLIVLDHFESYPMGGLRFQAVIENFSEVILSGFHDCVGGCNGCIKFNNPDNNGLQPVVDTLNAIYYNNSFKSFGASRADFWALAASVGLSIAVRNSNSQRTGLSCSQQSCPGP